MSKKPKVSFIISTYNRAEYLKDSLHSLIHSAMGYPVEILVIDNNSTDSTPDVCTSSKALAKTKDVNFQQVRETEQGLSHARNRGIKEAMADFIIFLDDDIRVPESFVNAWLRFFDLYPEAKAGGGKIHVQFDDPRPEWMSSYLLPLLGHHDHGEAIKPYKSNDYPFGGNMAFKKEVFEEIGYFRTDLGRIGSDLKASEEKELFQRLREANETIYYVPDAFLYHRVNASRLTKEYIRRQAIGLGQSMKLQMKRKSEPKKTLIAAKEIGKWIATAVLFIKYCLKFEASKGATLFQFRNWIREGLFYPKDV